MFFMHLIAPSWNWNRDYRLWPIAKKHPLNRTILELKYVKVNVQRRNSTLNRTILELKCVHPVLEQVALIHLIAPSWNWNSLLSYFNIKGTGALNRTILELKYVPKTTDNEVWRTLNRTILELKWIGQSPRSLFKAHLIAPSWNWNLITLSGKVNPYLHLIAPSWNWNM